MLYMLDVVSVFVVGICGEYEVVFAPPVFFVVCVKFISIVNPSNFAKLQEPDG